ncbi:hypothetical protein GCM10027073_41300 [Streptomyces chlorus]|uniref:DUF397 domain-containing protein n=1 Tax=Streptomyces chlorus TaxID=887452 RepID=A0ABW1DZA7_9ACTN
MAEPLLDSVTQECSRGGGTREVELDDFDGGQRPDAPRQSLAQTVSGGECLEAAIPSGAEAIRIRDSKVAGGAVVTVSREAWSAFLTVRETLLSKKL